MSEIAIHSPAHADLSSESAVKAIDSSSEMLPVPSVSCSSSEHNFADATAESITDSFEQSIITEEEEEDLILMKEEEAIMIAEEDGKFEMNPVAINSSNVDHNLDMLDGRSLITDTGSKPAAFERYNDSSVKPISLLAATVVGTLSTSVDATGQRSTINFSQSSSTVSVANASTSSNVTTSKNIVIGSKGNLPGVFAPKSRAHDCNESLHSNEKNARNKLTTDEVMKGKQKFSADPGMNTSSFLGKGHSEQTAAKEKASSASESSTPEPNQTSKEGFTEVLIKMEEDAIEESISVHKAMVSKELKNTIYQTSRAVATKISVKAEYVNHTEASIAKTMVLEVAAKAMHQTLSAASTEVLIKVERDATHTVTLLDKASPVANPLCKNRTEASLSAKIVAEQPTILPKQEVSHQLNTNGDIAIPLQMKTMEKLSEERTRTFSIDIDGSGALDFEDLGIGDSVMFDSSEISEPDGTSDSLLPLIGKKKSVGELSVPYETRVAPADCMRIKQETILHPSSTCFDAKPSGTDDITTADAGYTSSVPQQQQVNVSNSAHALKAVGFSCDTPQQNEEYDQEGQRMRALSTSGSFVANLLGGDTDSTNKKRDRGMSFDFFSFGINEEETIPSSALIANVAGGNPNVEETAGPPTTIECQNSHVVACPATQENCLPETTLSSSHINTTSIIVGGRQRGDSIIFDPTSFTDGGIHELNALRKQPLSSVSQSATNGLNCENHEHMSHAKELEIMNGPGFVECPIPSPPISPSNLRAQLNNSRTRLTGDQLVSLNKKHKKPSKAAHLEYAPSSVPSNPLVLSSRSQYRNMVHHHQNVKPSSALRTTASCPALSHLRVVPATPQQSYSATAASASSTNLSTRPSTISLTHSSHGNPMDLLNRDGRIGIYLPDERRLRIAKFHSKRKMRIWRKRIKYDCRKKLADSRPRIKGRFVRREQTHTD